MLLIDPTLLTAQLCTFNPLCVVLILIVTKLAKKYNQVALPLKSKIPTKQEQKEPK